MAYRIAPAPRFAAMRAWDCARCGRAEVRPVFLAENGGPAVAYGTGCAAKLLGYRRPELVRQAADAADRAEAARLELLEERRAAYTAALAQFRARLEGSDPAELARARRTYWQGGGAAQLGSFPAWMAHVAETGELELEPAA